MMEKRPASAVEILKLARTGITCPDQDEYAAAGPPCALKKRFDRIAPEIRIHGECVRIPDGMDPSGDRCAFECGIGVGACGGSDVISLGVQDRHQPALPGALQQSLLGRESR